MLTRKGEANLSEMFAGDSLDNKFATLCAIADLVWPGKQLDPFGRDVVAGPPFHRFYDFLKSLLFDVKQGKWQLDKTDVKFLSAVLDEVTSALENDGTVFGHGNSVDSLFPMDDTQKAMFEALDGTALQVEQLANRVGVEPSFLYKHGLKDYVAAGVFKHKPGVGYFRPDAPPPDRMQHDKKPPQRKKIGKK